MHRLVKSIFLISLLLFFPLVFVFAEEITITTYYPSPYGSYNQLQTSTLGVGDNNVSGGLDSGDVPDPDSNPGDVWIKGNVGIGTMAPSTQLHCTGQITMDGVSGGDHVLDVAEVIPVADDVQEGEVISIDATSHKYQFIRSAKPNDTLVVGVVSSTQKGNKSIPAMFIGNDKQREADNPGQRYKYLTIAGQVAVKVCLEGGTINKGDLLTSSSVSGYAMKSQRKQLGTIIGKAMEDFDGKEEEKGIIIALLNLI